MATTAQNSPPKTGKNPSLDQIGQIARWFEIAVPNPSERNVHTQIGVHFEEVSEMFQALTKTGATISAREQLSFAADVLNFVQRRLKSGDLGISFDKIDREVLLDSLCGQIVTAVGVAHMLGMNIEGALKEVADSNDTKFGEDGRPVFNGLRKIIKGPNYRSPDLAAFTIRGDCKDGRKTE